MNLVDALRVAWQGTARRRLRTVLTAASLTIGVLTLVVVQSAQSLVHEATLHRAILRNGPATTVRIGLTTQASPQYWRDRAKRAVPGADVAVYDSYSSVNLSTRDGDPLSVDLAAVEPSLLRIRPFDVVTGSWFTEARLAPQLVVNRAAGRVMGVARLAAPEGAVTVVVVGVVDDGDPTPHAYLAASDEPALAAAGLRPVGRSVLLSAGSIAPDRLRSIAEIAGRAGDIEELSRVDTVNEFDDQLATQRRIFLAIAILCLVVGSLGILNIGLSALRERTEELALRRALGASRFAIATIMILESQIVALVAAALAIVAAFGAVPWFLAHLTSVPVDSAGPPLSALGLGLSASALAALAGALAPSLRAARVPIANLLR